jgi:GT2 family glycosyltransferase
VVVVNWNQLDRTLACLGSLQLDGAALLPVLVDSASDEDPTSRVESAVPGIRVVRLKANSGYASACNAGARVALDAGATHLLLLNNDTIAAPGALNALLAASARRPDAVLGPMIVYGDRPDRVWAAGGRVTHPWLKTVHVGEGEPAGLHGGGAAVDWVSGCALFAPASVFRAVGPLDEAFFLYLEDTDWCLRARALGFQCLFVPEAVIRHDVSSTVVGLPSSQLRYYSYRNHYRFALRHGSWWERPLIAVDLAWTLAKIGLRTALFPAYRRDRWYQARTRGLLDHLRGRWGQGAAA